MKNYFKILGITAIALVIGLSTISCDVEPEEDPPPPPPPEEGTTPSNPVVSVPTNVEITVNKRTMIVTWDEVTDATGYEIVTYSEGCGSGRRIINTKDKTAFSFDGTTTGTTNFLTAAATNATAGTPQTNGSVIILAKNSIMITLMPSTDNNEDKPNTPMASSVTAKVKSLAGSSGSDSEYSTLVTLAKADYIKPALGTPVNGIPSTVKITVLKRSMIVTWDEVTDATGYEIVTYSEGCGSGKRIINTKDKTAFSFDGTTTGTANILNNANATTGLQNSGSVIILAKNAILITLMPATSGDDSSNTPMASSVTAKVKSFAGNSGSDSEYSTVVTLAKADYTK